MTSKILRITAIVLIIVSIAVFLYPNICKLIMKEKNNDIIDRFDHISEGLQGYDGEQIPDDGIVDVDGYLVDENGDQLSDFPVVFSQNIDRLHTDSISYNELLRTHQDLDCDFSEAALDLTCYGIYDGMYGYISAPAIGLNVPIYLGAGESNLACGAAHLMNTSLPLGGEDTNAVFAGHTGYFGRNIFDRLPELKTGDTVSVTTYFDTLYYRVISAKEISATSTNDIFIVKGKDLLTLLTCANSGKTRYEVICERS